MYSVIHFLTFLYFQNLKEKIKIKDETIKLLTEKVEKYWPQRVENLNHIISVKRERIASKSSRDVEELVEPSSSSVPSSCASNSSNLNNFFELNEKLADNEDFIKSLKTIDNKAHDILNFNIATLLEIQYHGDIR